MNTEEFIKSHFEDTALNLASLMGIDKSHLAQLLDIDEITLTIKLPKFISHSFMEVYPTKEEALEALAGCLEEEMINKVMDSKETLISMLSLFLSTGLKK